MAAVERYNSFEEMDKALSDDQAKTKPRNSNSKNTIKAFAALLRRNIVPCPKPDTNRNSK